MVINDDDDDHDVNNIGNNMGDWDYFRVIQKIREQYTRKT